MYDYVPARMCMYQMGAVLMVVRRGYQNLLELELDMTC